MAGKRRQNSSDRLKKIQIAAYLEPEQAEALKALSARTRVPMQVYLRDGLELILQQHGMTKKKAVGK